MTEEDDEDDDAEQYFKAWNTCVKLVYKVPRSTYTYLVEGFLARDYISLRNQVLSRYPGFLQNLLASPSKEVRLLANIVARDPQSTTSRNIKYIETLTDLSSWDYCKNRIKQKLPVKEVPENQQWRLGLISKLLQMREEKFICVDDQTKLCSWLDSLCST